MEKMRKRIFNIIEIGNREDVPSTLFDIFISITIITSIVTTFLHTFKDLAGNKVVSNLELATIIIFVVEYLLRIWTAGYLFQEEKYPRAVLKYIFSGYGLIDLLSIVSYFIPVIFTTGVVVLRMLRVVRILRLFQLSANYDAFNVIVDVIKAKKNALISSVFMILMLMLMSSMCMYSIENTAQPDVFDNAFSGIWWSVSTILTVGYGDIYPVTTIGKLIAIIMAFLGVGMVAIPTGIISAGFVEYYSKAEGDHTMRVCLSNESEGITEVYECARMKAQDNFIPNREKYEISDEAYNKVAGRPCLILYPMDTLDIIVEVMDSFDEVNKSVHRMCKPDSVLYCDNFCKFKRIL